MCRKFALKIQNLTSTYQNIYVELTYIIYHTGNGGIAAWIEDGFCDDINNKKECHFDGADCCGLTKQNNLSAYCMCKCKWNTDIIKDDVAYYNTWILM